MDAETAFLGASKFETFIIFLQLVFELELLKPPIGISVFDSETHITSVISPKICTKTDPYVPHLSFKFQVSTFSRFDALAFSTLGCRIRNFAWKKTIGTSNAKHRESPNFVLIQSNEISVIFLS